MVPGAGGDVTDLPPRVGAEGAFNALGCASGTNRPLMFRAASLRRAGEAWRVLGGRPAQGVVTVAFQSQGTSLSPSCSSDVTRGTQRL